MRQVRGVLGGVAIGAGVAVQGRVNGALGVRLHDGIAAAAVGFGLGSLVLVVAWVASRRMRDGVGEVRRALVERRLRPWMLLGGLCGAMFVAAQGLTIAVIGVTTFTVAAVAGQLASSLVVDRLGLGPAGRTPVTVTRALGAGLAVVAVVLTGVGRNESDAVVSAVPEALPAVAPWLLAVLPALAGIGLAWQQAVNGRVGVVGGPFAAALVNFGVGFAALAVLTAAVWTVAGAPAAWPADMRLYLGGFIGVGFIALAALVVRWIGVLLLGLTSVAGQLVTALVLDVLAPTEARMSATTVVGCVLVLAAVLVATRTGGPTARA